MLNHGSIFLCHLIGLWFMKVKWVLCFQKKSIASLDLSFPYILILKEKECFTYQITFLYAKFCDLYMTTREQCCKTARERLELDSRLKQLQFGNQTEPSSEEITLPVSKPSPRVSRKTDHKLSTTKGICISCWELCFCWRSCSGSVNVWEFV